MTGVQTCALPISLGRYGDEAEDKSLYATRFLEPESLGVKFANDGLIEIVYQCRKQKKDRVICLNDLGSLFQPNVSLSERRGQTCLDYAERKKRR